MKKHSRHQCPSCGDYERCPLPGKCVENGTEAVPLYCPSCAIARGRGFPPSLRRIEVEGTQGEEQP